MAGWIKVEVLTPDKPEVIGIAHALGLEQDAVTGKLIRLWCWADQHTTDGNAVSVTRAFVDRYLSVTGFADAMVKVGWLIESDGGLRFPNFDRHNTESSKQRALTAKRVAKHKGKSNAEGNGNSVTAALPRTTGEQEEDHLLKSNRKTTGSSVSNEGDSQLSPLPRLPKEISGQKAGGFDLSMVDWGHVQTMTDVLCRKIPPDSEASLRVWLKYAVLADVRFSEDWLMDSIEGMKKAKETKTTEHKHFGGILKSKAAADGVDEEAFGGMMFGINIPTTFWKSNLKSKGNPSWPKHSGKSTSTRSGRRSD